MNRWYFLVLLAIPAPQFARAQDIDFAHDVVPILKTHCVRCHGGNKSEGGFSLDTRKRILNSDAAVPGKPAASRLLALVRSSDADDQMPPSDRKRVPPAQIGVLAKWIAAGMKWEPGFTFGPRAYEPPLRPRTVELPAARDGRTHPIDRVIDHYQAERGLRSPKPITDAAFLRRTKLDIVGLLPTLGELDRFGANTASDRQQKWIDELLSRDRDYAEHWMSFWNDLLRNAYAGTGYIDGGRQQITAWLYRSLVENKPYDQFTSELISPPNRDSEGFIRGIKWRGNVNASQVRELQFSQSVSQVFLGINMKCASCHDSFIDRWTLEDAYGLAAIYSKRELEIHRCDKPTGRVAKAAWMFPQLGSVDASEKQSERLRQLATLITHKDNGRFTRTIVNRIWHRFMGRGIVHPVDAMGAEPWSEDLLDVLANQFVKDGYDLKKLMRFIMTSHAYQSRSAVQTDEPASYAYTGPTPRRLTAEQFMDAVRSLSGTWTKPGAADLKSAGRGQGGQLAAFLKVHEEPASKWPRPLRASLAQPDALQISLGRPNREQIVSERPNQLSTLEAINISNAELLDTLLKHGAETIMKSDDVVGSAFRRLLSRSPDENERRLAEELVKEGRLDSVADLLWSLVVLPEFQMLQ